jgi:hypothetical protein
LKKKKLVTQIRNSALIYSSINHDRHQSPAILKFFLSLEKGGGGLVKKFGNNKKKFVWEIQM